MDNRSLDLKHFILVVNYDCPNPNEDFIKLENAPEEQAQMD
jgi:hypothetical protein